MAEISDVFFVDGVRTPFGRAGEKGMYWNTRADDLAVKATIGLMERNGAVPADRIDDVAIAATSQTGDQGLTLGRSVAILAGLPQTVPGLAVERKSNPEAGKEPAIVGLAVGEIGCQRRLGGQDLGGDQCRNGNFPHCSILSSRAYSSSVLQISPLPHRPYKAKSVTATTPTPIATQPIVDTPARWPSGPAGP